MRQIGILSIQNSEINFWPQIPNISSGVSDRYGWLIAWARNRQASDDIKNIIFTEVSNNLYKVTDIVKGSSIM